jgi:glycine dehydrogenase subunit 1
MAPDRLAIVKNYCKPEMTVTKVGFCKECGKMDLEDLKAKLNDDVASVYFENPIYLGGLEDQVEEIVKLAHDAGATVMVGVEPTSLGVLEAPGAYGAESFDWIDGIIDNTMRIEDGFAYPREGAGWGFVFKEEYLDPVE